MGKLYDMVLEFSKDPSKIESIPDILQGVLDIETSEINNQSILEKVQSSNRSLLSQIVEQPTAKEEDKQDYTAKDITASLIEELNGGK